ncbi:MAG: YcxB family protein [Pyrinomonadaceae bacterium]
MTDGKIEIEGFYEAKDFWRSALNYYFSLSSLYFSFWSLILYGLFLTFLFLKGNAGVSHFVNVILSSIAFVILYGLVMAYLAFGKTRELKWGKYKFIISNEKVEISTQSFASQINWDFFVRINETKHYFVLLSKAGQKTLLPKRFFRDSEQLAEFKNLIRSKLGEKVYLKKSKENLGLK